MYSPLQLLRLDMTSNGTLVTKNVIKPKKKRWGTQKEKKVSYSLVKT